VLTGLVGSPITAAAAVDVLHLTDGVKAHLHLIAGGGLLHPRGEPSGIHRVRAYGQLLHAPGVIGTDAP